MLDCLGFKDLGFHANRVWGCRIGVLFFGILGFGLLGLLGCYGSFGFGCLVCSWTPKVCRIMVFYRFWAIILPTLGGGGLGYGLGCLATDACREVRSAPGMLLRSPQQLGLGK